jgi:hypothetical protein
MELAPPTIRARRHQGLLASLREISGADYFSILDEIARSDGSIVWILHGFKAQAEPWDTCGQQHHEAPYRVDHVGSITINA